VTITTGLLTGWLAVGQAYLISAAVDGAFLRGQDLTGLQVWLAPLLVLVAARGLLTCLNEFSAGAVSVRVKDELRGRLFAHIQALGPAHSRGGRTGALSAAAVEGIEALDAYFGQYLPQVVVSTLVPLSILLLVFPLDPLSGVVLLLTAPLIPFFMYMIGRDARDVTHRQYETLSRLAAHFLDSLQGLTTLKLFGQARAQVDNIARVSDQYRDTTLRVLQVTFLSALALELLATLSTAIIAVEVGLRLLYAQMQFREALFLLVLAPEFYQPLRMLGQRFHAGMAGTSAARRIFEILDTPAGGQQARTPGAAAPDFDFSVLQLSGVSYTYPGETAPSLELIDLEIRRGEHIALVGRTGAGKSTLVSLLLGFIQPSAGRLSVDGTDPADRGLIRHIAWVPQRPHLFHDSIAANIRLGWPEASTEQVAAAARAAHLHEFIQSLPAQYETLIGEGGAKLSAGQAQRLALARAFLLQAPILILDEPTSSLDPETEARLEQSTRALMRGRTVITIAHRLNTVSGADRIVVLERGRIVEVGAHAELIQRAGTYAAMVGSQRSEWWEDSAASSHQKRVDPVTTAPPGIEFSGTRPNNRKYSDRTPFHPSPPVVVRLLSFLRGSWNRVLLSVVLSALTIGSSVALMGTSAWLISAAALHPSIGRLSVAIVGVRFFGISRAVFRYLERLISHDVTFRLLGRLRVWFYDRLEPLAPARLMDFRAGDLLARIVGDVETLQNFYVRVVAPPLTALLVMLATTAFLAVHDPSLALIVVTAFLLLGLALPLAAQVASRVPGAQVVQRRADLQALLVDGIQGLADTLAFGRATGQREQMQAAGRRYGAAQLGLTAISAGASGLSVFVTHFSLWLILVLTVPQIAAGRIQGVLLASLGLLSLASFEAVTPLPLAAQLWTSTRLAARRLFEVVDAEPEVAAPTHMTPAPTNFALRLSHLSFSYPGQLAPALQDVTFELEAGRSMAIVGPSGAGKSTLAHLLLRFWDYRSGEIRLGGASLKDFAPEDIHRCIGYVSHNAHFFNATIYENLRLARPVRPARRSRRPPDGPAFTSSSPACLRVTRPRSESTACG
jgi:ATP-binding cassette subfamily C protein CydCD